MNAIAIPVDESSKYISLPFLWIVISSSFRKLVTTSESSVYEVSYQGIDERYHFIAFWDVLYHILGVRPPILLTGHLVWDASECIWGDLILVPTLCYDVGGSDVAFVLGISMQNIIFQCESIVPQARWEFDWGNIELLVLNIS